MDALIKALQIMRKYGNPVYPTNCSHDLLYVCMDTNLFTEEDVKELDELGFFVDEELEGFCSFRFGSC